jgi:hypothetical protein
MLDYHEGELPLCLGTSITTCQAVSTRMLAEGELTPSPIEMAPLQACMAERRWISASSPIASALPGINEDILCQGSEPTTGL